MTTVTNVSELYAPTISDARKVELSVQMAVAFMGHARSHYGFDEVSAILGACYAAVNGIAEPKPIVIPEEIKPAVPIRKSVTPDYIVCLEDGRKLKSMKRYLRLRFNLTPEQYRAKWGLPADYPMAAPAYSARRSALAKKSGLGRKPVARKVAA